MSNVYWLAQPPSIAKSAPSGIDTHTLNAFATILRDLANNLNEAAAAVAWKRCEIVNKAEQASLRKILAKWGSGS